MFPLSRNHTINLQQKNVGKNACGEVSFLVKLPVKD